VRATGLFELRHREPPRPEGTPYWLGLTLLEHEQWLVEGGPSALLEEARSIFERLGAEPALEAAATLLPERAPA
jgi:hypothetical protein